MGKEALENTYINPQSPQIFVNFNLKILNWTALTH